jgi:hypothetical protein
MNYRNNKAALIRHIQTDPAGYLLLINTVLREIFHQPPIDCRLDHRHQRRIQKLITQEPDNDDATHRGVPTVKSEDYS